MTPADHPKCTRNGWHRPSIKASAGETKWDLRRCVGGLGSSDIGWPWPVTKQPICGKLKTSVSEPLGWTASHANWIPFRAIVGDCKCSEVTCSDQAISPSLVSSDFLVASCCINLLLFLWVNLRYDLRRTENSNQKPTDFPQPFAKGEANFRAPLLAVQSSYSRHLQTLALRTSPIFSIDKIFFRRKRDFHGFSWIVTIFPYTVMPTSD